MMCFRIGRPREVGLMVPCLPFSSDLWHGRCYIVSEPIIPPMKPLHRAYTRTFLEELVKSLFGKGKPEIIEDLMIEGDVNRSLKWKLTRQMNILMDKYESRKVGKSGDTFVRADYDEYRSKYNHMFVLYQSPVVEDVELLEEHYTRKFFDRLDNDRIGGGKMVSPDGLYYLYMVVS